MATININENETINVELGEQSSSINTTLKDINYIPSYKEAETERRVNEVNRITNENSREKYIEDFKASVFKGEFNGKDGAIQYTAGSGIKIENNVISATGGASSGGTWGSIEGTLSDQADLQEALNNKANTSDIPTKVSDLNNDSEFITKTVDNLTNYYKKNEIYTQEQVNTLISNVNSFNVEVAQTLPTENIDIHTIYLVPKKAETNDNYDEYIYINNSWEHIGSTSVDLTNYYNKNEIDTKLESKANATDLESKQNTLVSGTNIKTVNNNSLLGKGNINLNNIPVSATPPEDPEDGALWIDTNDNVLKKYNLSKNQWEIISGQITGDTLPIGAIMPYTSKTIPSNWLPCNGQAVSRTDYAELFAIIGTQYGAGDGSTTFNVPDLNDYKVPIGYDRFEEQSNRMNLGTTGGEETHKLTIDEMPAHAHNMPLQAGSETLERQYNASWLDNQSGNSGDTAATGIRTSYTGGSQAHNNMPPYVTTNYIIKAFQSAGVVAQVSNTKSDSTTDTYSCDYINNKLNDEDVSSQITLDDGYTKTIKFAIKQNNIIHINMVVDFTTTTIVNKKIGNHTFNLKKDCKLPIFAYGDGYTGGFGEIAFYTDGRIYLVAYSGSGNPIKQITCNGNLY